MDESDLIVIDPAVCISLNPVVKNFVSEKHGQKCGATWIFPEISSLIEFKEKLWLKVKPHLKRAISFVADNEDNPTCMKLT